LNGITNERHSRQSVLRAAKKPTNQGRLLQHLARRKLNSFARKLTGSGRVCANSATRKTVNNPLTCCAGKCANASANCGAF
jgi:hypothetical protein